MPTRKEILDRGDLYEVATGESLGPDVVSIYDPRTGRSYISGRDYQTGNEARELVKELQEQSRTTLRQAREAANKRYNQPLNIEPQENKNYVEWGKFEFDEEGKLKPKEIKWASGEVAGYEQVPVLYTEKNGEQKLARRFTAGPSKDTGAPPSEVRAQEALKNIQAYANLLSGDTLEQKSIKESKMFNGRDPRKIDVDQGVIGYLEKNKRKIFERALPGVPYVAMDRLTKDEQKRLDARIKMEAKLVEDRLKEEKKAATAALKQRRQFVKDKLDQEWKLLKHYTRKVDLYHPTDPTKDIEVPANKVQEYLDQGLKIGKRPRKITEETIWIYNPDQKIKLNVSADEARVKYKVDEEGSKWKTGQPYGVTDKGITTDAGALANLNNLYTSGNIPKDADFGSVINNYHVNRAQGWTADEAYNNAVQELMGNLKQTTSGNRIKTNTKTGKKDFTGLFTK